MSEAIAKSTAFTVRVSTVFIVLACLGFMIPEAVGWGAHDGGWPAVLFLSFPVSAVIAMIASLVYVARARSVQSWLEMIVAVGLVGFAALILL